MFFIGFENTCRNEELYHPQKCGIHTTLPSVAWRLKPSLYTNIANTILKTEYNGPYNKMF